MNWKNVFQKQYGAEIGKKGKKETDIGEQVSQFSLFPQSEEFKTIVTTKQLKEYLGNDWQDCKENPEILKACADALAKQRLMERGLAPPNYTSSMVCIHCGLVSAPPEFADGKIALGCPWCFNRTKGLPIPIIKEEA